MLTWFGLWPMLLMPMLLMVAAGLIPLSQPFGRAFGGPLVREWSLNHLVLPLLPDGAGWQLVNWFAHASLAQEWTFYLLVALNVNALCLPFLYAFGEGLIRLRAWATRTDLDLKHQALRR